MSTFVLTGAVAEAKQSPVAVLQTDREFTVLGSVVLLDATPSTDPDGNELTYLFSFLSVPIGSKVALEGFRILIEGGSSVSFSPDMAGRYVIGLVVSNGVFESNMVSKTIDVQAVLVPHAKGIVPDGKFIWSYLRDVWTEVEGKEFFETLWSALIQICGAELLKLYQVDFNKSIADIQELYQRRWLSYEPKLDLVADDLTYFIGNQVAGNAAATGATGASGLAVIVGANELMATQGAIRPDLAGRTFRVQYSRNPENVGDYTIHGVSSKPGGFFVSTVFPKNPTNTVPPAMSDLLAQNVTFSFAFQSKEWDIGGSKVYDFIMSDILGIPTYKTVVPPGLEDVRNGDVIAVSEGPNAGFYTVTATDGAKVWVHKAPPAASPQDGLTTKASVHRPVGFIIPPVEESLTDTITLPLAESGSLTDLAAGRVIIFNNQARTITRVSVDETQRVAVVVLVVESRSMTPGLKGLPWFIPNTLVSKSQNFSDLGVSAGDTLIASISNNAGLAVDVALQVVGVDGNRLGFVMSDEPMVPGEVPTIPPSTIFAITDRFGIKAVTQLPDGTIKYQDQAATFRNELRSVFFQRAYWNKELSPATEFRVAGASFYVTPKKVIRNSRVPVDTTVRSIPALQEYVRQPEVETVDGQLYRKYPEHLIPITRNPAVLTERYHHLVDADLAFSGTLTFRTGTDVIDADGGDFVDLGLSSGDSFIIDTPLTLAGSYEIVQVLSRNRMKLVRQVAKYPLSDYVSAKVRLVRASTNRYLRFIPGLFTAKNPAPERLWGEVTFFDNDPNIERNFGILVGLTKADIEAVSGNATYRQAVSGLMYSYVMGPAVDKVRLGASLLLGLPFTERRGIIRSIENDYRLDAAGLPITGRILVEDVGQDNTPSGIMRIYTFPIDTVSKLAGVDTNPATGVPYVVGDIAEAYASLAKGVEIEDFMSPYAGMNPIQLLQRYHSMRVRINDNIFKPEEVRLVSDFLRKITPSYISLVITNSAEYQDDVTVRDRVRLRMQNSVFGTAPFVDHVGNLFPIPLAFDAKLFSGIHWMQWDGTPSEARYAGKDVVVDVADHTKLNVPSGGLLNPAGLRVFEAPLCKVGDKLVLASGADKGIYTISEITDTSMKVSDGPSAWTFTGVVHFAILRPAHHLLRAGTIFSKTDGVYTDPSNARVYDYSLVTVEPGLRTDGVAPGDWLLASDGVVSTRHLVVGVAGPTFPFPIVPDQLQTVPYNVVAVVPPILGAGAAFTNPTVDVINGVVIPTGVPPPTGMPTAYRVYRPAAFVSSVADLNATSDGTNTIAIDDPYIMALAEPGDEIQLNAPGLPRLLVLDPLNLWVTPAPAVGTYQAKLLKAGVGGASLASLGVATRLISDQAFVTISNEVTTATTDPLDPVTGLPRLPDSPPAPAPDCVIAGDLVSWATDFLPAAAGVRPGDFFRPLSAIGTNKTRDLGYGPGLYPIVEVSDTTVKLSVALANGQSQWAVMRRA